MMRRFFFFKQGVDVVVSSTAHDVIVYPEDIKDTVEHIWKDQWRCQASGRPTVRNGFVYQRLNFQLFKAMFRYTACIFQKWDRVCINDDTLHDSLEEFERMGGVINNYPDDMYRLYLAFVLRSCELEVGSESNG